MCRILDNDYTELLCARDQVRHQAIAVFNAADSVSLSLGGRNTTRNCYRWRSGYPAFESLPEYHARERIYRKTVAIFDARTSSNRLHLHCSECRVCREQQRTLEAGKRADLVVLSQNIFQVPLDEIPKTESALTITDLGEKF